MPFPIALRRALTALVGAVFAILCMGVGAVGAPTAKTGATAPTNSATQPVTNGQVRAADTPNSADDSLPALGQQAIGMAPTQSWTVPDFAPDTTTATSQNRIPRSEPAASGRAPPA